MKQTIGTLVLVALTLGAVWMLKPTHESVPDLALNYTDGTTGKLSDLRGQPVVINFWSVNCPACIKDAPEWAKLHPQLLERNVALIGISIPQDPPPAIIAMLAQIKPPYPTIFDVHGELSRGFNTKDITPTTIILDREGKIARRMVGELHPVSVKAALSTL